MLYAEGMLGAKTKIKKSIAYSKVNMTSLLLFVVGVLLLVVGGLKLVDRHVTTTTPATLPAYTAVVEEDIAQPQESKPNNAAYSVPADMPRSIIIESIGATGIIQNVGINKQGAIAVPTNVHYAGWFTQSVKPGQDGLSIIDGHVMGRYSDGIFKNLKLLKKGDKVQVEYGNKSLKTFEVVEVKTVPEDQATSLLFDKKADIAQQLNLITCDGKFNKDTQSYTDRVVVIAKLV